MYHPHIVQKGKVQEWILKKLLLTLSLLLTFCGNSQSSSETTEKDECVVKVTLYKGQAQVTRRVNLPKGTGSKEIVISNLPRAIISSSLFAEGGAGVEVQTLRYRERYLAPEDIDDSEIERA